MEILCSSCAHIELAHVSLIKCTSLKFHIRNHHTECRRSHLTPRGNKLNILCQVTSAPLCIMERIMSVLSTNSTQWPKVDNRNLKCKLNPNSCETLRDKRPVPVSKLFDRLKCLLSINVSVSCRTRWWRWISRKLSCRYGTRQDRSALEVSLTRTTGMRTVRHLGMTETRIRRFLVVCGVSGHISMHVPANNGCDANFWAGVVVIKSREHSEVHLNL